MIPRAKIEEWKRLSFGARKGPWAVQDEMYVVAADGGRVLFGDGGGWGTANPEDAALIAASREAIPALLSERETLLGMIREVGLRRFGDPEIGWVKCSACSRFAVLSDEAHRMGAFPHAPDCRLAAALREET